MSSIFISYRREDAADVTGRINDRLSDRFGKAAVFTDVNKIPLGLDFRKHLDNEVKQCDVLLAVIGKDWLTVSASEDQSRLSDPTDFVRIEIESALSRDIPVIPVLVSGASMPSVAELPESLHELAYRNAIKIRPDPDFDNDAERLIDSLRTHFEASPGQREDERDLDPQTQPIGTVAPQPDSIDRKPKLTLGRQLALVALTMVGFLILSQFSFGIGLVLQQGIEEYLMKSRMNHTTVLLVLIPIAVVSFAVLMRFWWLACQKLVRLWSD